MYNATEISEIFNNSLSSLETLIETKLGFKPTLEVKVTPNSNANEYYVEIYSDNLISELGTTLVKTIFSKVIIKINNIFNLDESIKQYGFLTNLKYEHPSGGSNGVQFIWNSIVYNLESKEWIEGYSILK